MVALPSVVLREMTPKAEDDSLLKQSGGERKRKKKQYFIFRKHHSSLSLCFNKLKRYTRD